MIKELRLIILLVSGIILFSCSSQKQGLRYENLDKIYDPYSSSIHPDIQIYNDSDSTSLVVIKLKSKELMYNLANEEHKLLSRIQVMYTLFDHLNKETFIDSLSANFRFARNQDKEYHVINLSIPTSLSKKYIIEINVTDQNRRSSAHFINQINRIEKINPQDFLVFNPLNNEYQSDNYILKERKFSFNHYKQPIDSMFVSYYKNSFFTPQAPFIVDTTKDDFSIADTAFVCYPDSIDYSSFSNEGVYFFSSVLNAENGFYLFNFGDDFPEYIKPSDLIKPLSYLGMSETIDLDSIDEKTAKLELDKFWLLKGSDIERSRELIRLFYSRVKFANRYFTSYKPGWQTDRGMIYVVCGLPDFIIKSGSDERWIFKPTDSWPGNEFVFEQVDHKFSTNHFVLNRNKQKSTGWDDAVKLWNSGEISNYQNQ